MRASGYPASALTSSVRTMPMPVIYTVFAKNRPIGIVCHTPAKLASVAGWGISAGGKAKTAPRDPSAVASSQRNGNTVTTAIALSSRYRPAVCPARDRRGRGALVIGQPPLAHQPEIDRGEQRGDRRQHHADCGGIAEVQR